MADELDQDAIEALIAAQAAEAAGADAPADEAVEAEVVAEAEPAIDEIEAELLAAEETEHAPVDGSSDAPLTPEQIEALLMAEAGPAVPAAPVAAAAPPAVAGPLIEEVAFTELPPVRAPMDELADIDLLLDVPLQITVELGQARRTIRELLELGQGSILHLTRHAGEPVDVLVNGQHIARGEVVVIDENFGIRVTEVVSPAERLRTMAA
jgi:flagellar motor switch protein FliN/FliY